MKIRLSIETPSGIEVKPMAASWDEITFSQFAEIQANAKVESVFERALRNISILSGISNERLLSFPPESIEAIIPHLEFIDRIDSILAHGVPESVAAIEIGQHPWKLLEAAKQIITNSHNQIAAIPKVVELYCPELGDITNKPMPEAYPIAVTIMGKIEQFFQRYSRLNDFKPDADQKYAGIDRLSNFGFFNTMHTLAGGDPLKYDALLEQPAEIIYQTLLFDFEKAEYDKRLTEAKTKSKRT